LALANYSSRIADYWFAIARTSLCPRVTDKTIDMVSESLELWTVVVSAMLSIVVFDDVAATTESFSSRLMGCIAAVAELEEVPLVLTDGVPELGAEYLFGSEENHSFCSNWF
jgi:hypothetical protein